MKIRKQFLALLLAAMVLLSACGTTKDAAREEDEDESTEPREQGQMLPTQDEMPRDELEQLLLRAEYAALAAAIARDEIGFLLDGYVISGRYAYLGDVDADGTAELMYSMDALQFDLSEGKTATYQWEQSGNDMYVSEDGRFYLNAGVGGSWEESDSSGGYVMRWESDDWYKEWNGSEWESVITTSLDETFAIVSQDPYTVASEPTEHDFSAEVYGKPMGEAEFRAYLEERGMTRVTSRVGEYTTVSCDASYTDCVMDALDDYLKDSCDTYAGMVSGDFDGDGFEECLYLIHNIYDPWVESIYRHAENTDSLPWVLEATINADGPRTTLLLADVQGQTLTIQAADCSGNLSAHSGNVEYRDGSLWVDGTAIYMTGVFSVIDELDDDQKISVYSAICRLLSGYGFANTTIKLADVADMEGTELLGICQKDGSWYVVVMALRNGAVIPIDCVNAGDQACYLTEYQGQLCLLSYSQSIEPASQGSYWTYYSYTLFRYDEMGQFTELDGMYISCNSKEKDASQVAAFFDKLNRYLVHVTVLRDPYMLLGQQWILREEAEYTVRSNSNIEEEDVEGKLGFVQISDPGSWLNLRKGPGTQYDRVLVDPSDPNSFVRQALGAPVTVLETIETGDPDNPVWVRIRIRYGDLEIVGYSSAKYIRMQDE